MLNTLVWRSLDNPDVAADVLALRNETLRALLWGTTIGYVGWHCVTAYQASAEEFALRWRLFPIVATVLLATFLLRERQPVIATWVFLLGLSASATAATVMLGTPLPISFYALLVLAAVILLHPLAGLVVCLGAWLQVALLLGWAPSPFVDAGLLSETGMVLVVALAVGWLLGRNLVTAVEWAMNGYQLAVAKTEAVREHRAQLVKTLRQLDIANYRLERANESLQAAWKAADAAERSRAEFVANISHELRTPLNLIVGFSEMIITSPETYRTPLPAAYRGDLNAIYRSAQHLLTLAEDVLDLTRVGMGRVALFREPVSIPEIVREACSIVREYVETKGLSLSVRVAERVPVADVDRLRIRQVILNLLTNAARFTDEGGVTVEVASEAECVTVTVRDSGRGIPPEELPHVFDESRRPSGKAARPSHHDLGGFGLGLPLSKRFIDLHGGRIGVESQPGQGTSFWFSVPVHGSETASQTEAPGATGVHPPSTPRERCLVLADADSRTARFFQLHLRGVRVLAAPNTSKAVEEAIRHHASAVLADSSAADADPPPGLSVPIIRLPLPSGRRLAAAVGAADYLVKPVTRHQVQEAIKRLDRPIRKVVIVDDDTRFVRLLSAFVRTLSPTLEPEVHPAHHGEEALQIIEQVRPDLVLLDLTMPELGGLGVLQAMASQTGLAAIPVIVVSGMDGSEGVALAGGLTVVKPDGFGLEEILATIEVLTATLKPARDYLTRTAAGAGSRPIGKGARPPTGATRPSAPASASGRPAR
jgi:signal transduction histidine kinase/CheY-like chemotaxis protein